MTKGSVTLPPVSVALSTYNGERFLQEQLESLAGQKLPPAELVACDDASSDRTVAILESFALSAPFPVRVFRNERNLGFTASFLTAAGRCESPLIAFCDQDDLWLEDKIAVCAQFFADHPEASIAVHSAQPVDESLRPLGDLYPAVPATRVMAPLRADPWMPAPGFTIVVERALLEAVDWADRPPSRDLDGHPMDFDEWIFLLAWSLGGVGFIGDCLVRYRQHGSNVIGAPDEGWKTRLRKLLTEDFATQASRTLFADANASYLERVAGEQRVGTEIRTRFSAAARYWRAYEQLARNRDAFYEARSRMARSRRLFGLLRARAYRRRAEGGLGGLALVRDLRELVLPHR